MRYIVLFIFSFLLLLNISYSQGNNKKLETPPVAINEWNQILSLIDNNENEEAKAKLNEFIKKYPKTKLTPSALYQSVMLEKDVSKTTLTLQRIVKEFPETTWASLAQYKIGDINFIARNYDIALTAFELYINEFPSGQWIEKAKLNRALCFLHLEKYDDAYMALKELQKTNFTLYDTPEYYIALGECQMMLQKYTDAISTFDIIIQRFTNSPNLPQAYLCIGLAYEDSNDFKNAEDTYTALTEAVPTSSEAMLARKRLESIKILKNLVENVASEQ